MVMGREKKLVMVRVVVLMGKGRDIAVEQIYSLRPVSPSCLLHVYRLSFWLWKLTS